MSQNGDRLTPPQGIPARELLKVLTSKSVTAEEAIEELRENVRLTRENVERHDLVLGGIMSELGSLSTKVGDLERDVRHALKVASTPPPPAMPPMRAELPSHVDVRELARAIKNATLEGERRPDTTPDEQVDRVLERVVVMRAGRWAFKVLALAGAGGAAILFEHIVAALLR